MLSVGKAYAWKRCEEHCRRTRNRIGSGMVVARKRTQDVGTHAGTSERSSVEMEEKEERGKASAKEVEEGGLKRAIDEMMDLERLGKRGEAWFVAQMVLFGLVVFPPHVGPLISVVAPLLVPSGLSIIVAGQSVLGGNLSPFPEPSKTNQLVTSGIYGLIRHPMYTGGLLCALGLSSMTSSKERMFLTLVLFFVLNVKASKEEKAMTKKHPEYAEYMRTTYKFFPWIY